MQPMGQGLFGPEVVQNDHNTCPLPVRSEKSGRGSGFKNGDKIAHI